MNIPLKCVEKKEKKIMIIKHNKPVTDGGALLRNAKKSKKIAKLPTEFRARLICNL